MRIGQWLSQAGVCSRREAQRLISQGRIKVNDEIINSPVMISESDQVFVDQQLVAAAASFEYVIYNKPVGIDCNCKPDDPNSISNRLKLPTKLFPVGRIDKDSHGLMLLTNDGALCQKLLSPNYNHPKSYRVKVRPHYGKPSIDSHFAEAMQAGVLIDGQVTKPCLVTLEAENQFIITLTQGLNRQIRKMSRQLGYHVIDLQRISITHLSIEGLALNHWRYLPTDEIVQLQQTISKPAQLLIPS